MACLRGSGAVANGCPFLSTTVRAQAARAGIGYLLQHCQGVSQRCRPHARALPHLQMEDSFIQIHPEDCSAQGPPVRTCNRTRHAQPQPEHHREGPGVCPLAAVRSRPVHRPVREKRPRAKPHSSSHSSLAHPFPMRLLRMMHRSKRLTSLIPPQQ